MLNSERPAFLVNPSTVHQQKILQLQPWLELPSKKHPERFGLSKSWSGLDEGFNVFLFVKVDAEFTGHE